MADGAPPTRRRASTARVTPSIICVGGVDLAKVGDVVRFDRIGDGRKLINDAGLLSKCIGADGSTFP